MSEIIKIGQDSKCAGCTSTPQQDQCTECSICKSVFHGYCEEVAKEDQLGNENIGEIRRVN